MISEEEMTSIEELETRLLNNKIPLTKIRDHFASLISKIINSKIANGHSDEALTKMKNHLSYLASFRLLETNEKVDVWKFEEVWEIERKYKTLDHSISGLARCIIHCLAEYETWDEINQGEATPLFYLYFDLKKSDPTLTGCFFDHFARLAN